MARKSKPAVTMSAVGAIVRGAVAGAVGIVAFDAYNYGLYRSGGGTDAPLAWEFSAGLDSWDHAPAPALVGKRIYEGLLQKELPATSARTVNNVMHWGYGIVWGAQYGILASSLRRRRLQGQVFGTLVFLSGYAVLPLAKLYKPIWEYDAKVLAKDWSAHLTFGTTTAAAFSVLAGKEKS
ncbi:MAG: hypothetical protein ACRDZ8_15900 [Acidimicrobiales bacterium]